METAERLNNLLSTPRVFGARSLMDAAYNRLPDRPGIYIVVHPEYGILYVGKAKSLRRRCSSRPWFLIKIQVIWFDLDRSDHDLVEQHLIRTWKPAWNIAHNRKRPRRS